MSMSDTIADMLTRVRNAQAAEKFEVTMPGSKVKTEIARVLKEEGYIMDYQSSQNDSKVSLTIKLKYHAGRPVIETLKRVSRPGLRRYKAHDDLPRVMGGFGVAIVSTSRGIMTDVSARKAGIGGEVLCVVS